MSVEEGAERSLSVELLIFESAGQRYGVEATQVVRVDRASNDAPWLPSTQAPEGNRALVFRSADGEAQLRVDRILGVQPVDPPSLRRIPKAARMSDYALGFWLDGEEAVLLVDLSRTHSAAADSERS